MAYKYAKGKVYRGDIYDQDDTQRDTYIDFGGETTDNYIGLVTSGSTALAVKGSSVGIGTAAPTRQLDIEGSSDAYIQLNATSTGNAYTIGASSRGFIIYDDTTGGGSGFRLVVSDGDGATTRGYVGIGDGVSISAASFPLAQLHVSSSDGGAAFRVDGELGNPALFVTGSGKVGIGTATPTEKLEVYPDTDISAVIGRAHIGSNGAHTDAATFSHVDLDASTTYALYQGASGLTILNAASGQELYFRIANSDVMRIDSDGKLGVGTTSPTSTFEVSGSQAGNYTQTTGNITFNETHYIVDYTGDGAATFTLPNVSGITGRTYHIISHNQHETAALTITGSGGQFQGPNLDDDSDSIDIDGWVPQSITVVSTGGNWFILTDNRSQGPG
jgi:hypothetical protein